MDFTKRLSVIVAIATCGLAHAAEITIPASKDNTLYEAMSGNISNGAGEFMFAGAVGPTGGGSLRRALVAFDVAAIPAGSTITNVSLRLFMSKTLAGATPVALHKVSADWGEGASNAVLEEGQGATAAPGDATWTHRFFDTSLTWTSDGGDFAATASASTSVNLPGAYTWTSAGMLADVTGWHTSPATNFGWVLIGSETSAGSAKRFDTKENITASNRPVLTVTFTPPSAIPDWTLY